MKRKRSSPGRISAYGKTFLIIFFIFLCPVLSPLMAPANEASDVKKIYSSFRLEKKLQIDTGNKELIDRGLFDINNFAVDSAGNIYIINGKSQSDKVFVLDKNGHLIRSFARKGQGPGEIDNAYEIFLTSEGIFLFRTLGQENGHL